MRLVLVALAAMCLVTHAQMPSLYDQQSSLYNELVQEEPSLYDQQSSLYNSLVQELDEPGEEETIVGEGGVVDRVPDHPGPGDGFGGYPNEEPPYVPAPPPSLEPKSDDVPEGKLEGYKNYGDKILGDADVKEPIYEHTEEAKDQDPIINEAAKDGPPADEEPKVDDPFVAPPPPPDTDHDFAHTAIEDWHEMDDGHGDAFGSGLSEAGNDAVEAAREKYAQAIASGSADFIKTSNALFQ